MKKLSFTLSLCLSLLATSLLAQNPDDVSPFAEQYVDLLLKRDFQPAARLHHLDMSYVLKMDEWVLAQESTVNEDVSMRTTVLDITRAEVVQKTVNDQSYFLYTVPEELVIRLENDQMGDAVEIMSTIFADFQQQYGEDNVKKLDERSIQVERQHQFIVAPTGGETSVWRIFDFPNGRLDLAYGLLPVGVWDALFPGKSLATDLSYQLAIPQAVGHYYRLLRAKQYDAALMKTIPQPAAATPFMDWHKSLDTDETELIFYNYKITTPFQEVIIDGNRYAGFAVKWTLMLQAGEDASSQTIASIEKSIKEHYPNTEVIFDDMLGMFLWHTFTPVIVVADAGQNNWKLLLEDPANGMSIRKNFSAEVIRAIGID